MANQIKWNIGTVNGTTIINAQTLALGGNLLSDEIDNQANEDRFLNLELQITFGTAPGVASVIEVYILYALDGTNYEDGDATPLDPQKPIAELFGMRAVTTAQRQVIADIPIQRHKFKILLKNEAGQASTTNSTTLKAWTANEEIQ